MYSIDITSPAYGPYGVGRRADGKVILVRLAVPGDRVQVEPVKETSGMIEAVIDRLLERSPNRRMPPCPASPRCGGCSWLHYRREAQHEFKNELIARAVRNLIPPDEIEPIQQSGHWRGYRQRARLQVQAGAGESIRIGFFSHGTHDLVPLSRCLVCLPELSGAIGTLAKTKAPADFTASVQFVVGDRGDVLAGFYLGDSVEDPLGLADCLGENSSLDGVAVASPGSQPVGWGRQFASITVFEEPQVYVPVFPAAFCQANRFVNRLLVSHVVDLFKQVGRDKGILELYAGHGNFSYPLAAVGFDVDAVETAVAQGVLPASPRVRFERRSAAAACQSYVKEGRKWPNLLLDPPRSGAKDVMPFVQHLSPKNVVYVSCDPNTFARDAARLRRQGYNLTRLTPFDMMPHTFHVELVGLFEKA